MNCTRIIGTLLIASLTSQIVGIAYASDKKTFGDQVREPIIVAQKRPMQINNLTVELETHILWSAVDQKWVKRRDGWIKALQTAKRPSQIGALLAELETNILWSAVNEAWKTRRDSWLKDVQTANSNSRIGALLAELETNILWSAVDEGWKTRRDSWLEDIQSIR